MLFRAVCFGLCRLKGEWPLEPGCLLPLPRTLEALVRDRDAIYQTHGGWVQHEGCAVELQSAYLYQLVQEEPEQAKQLHRAAFRLSINNNAEAEEWLVTSMAYICGVFVSTRQSEARLDALDWYLASWLHEHALRDGRRLQQPPPRLQQLLVRARLRRVWLAISEAPHVLTDPMAEVALAYMDPDWFAYQLNMMPGTTTMPRAGWRLYIHCVERLFLPMPTKVVDEALWLRSDPAQLAGCEPLLHAAYGRLLKRLPPNTNNADFAARVTKLLLQKKEDGGRYDPLMQDIKLMVFGSPKEPHHHLTAQLFRALAPLLSLSSLDEEEEKPWIFMEGYYVPRRAAEVFSQMAAGRLPAEPLRARSMAGMLCLYLAMLNDNNDDAGLATLLLRGGGDDNNDGVLGLLLWRYNLPRIHAALGLADTSSAERAMRMRWSPASMLTTTNDDDGITRTIADHVHWMRGDHEKQRRFIEGNPELEEEGVLATTRAKKMAAKGIVEPRLLQALHRLSLL